MRILVTTFIILFLLQQNLSVLGVNTNQVTDQIASRAVSDIDSDKYRRYITKIVPPVDCSTLLDHSNGLCKNLFADIELDKIRDKQVLAWLKDLDEKLNPDDIGNYDANFLIKFDRDGYVEALSIDTIREDDLQKFKDLVAKVVSLQAKPLPQAIEPSTIFNLDATLLYIERKLVIEDETTIVDNNLSDASVLEILNLDTIDVILTKPNYIDHPSLGEELVFNLVDSKAVILRSNVIDIEKSYIQVYVRTLIDGNKVLPVNLAYNLVRPKNNSRAVLGTALASGIAAATQAGVGGSVASYGILPGALAVTGIAGTALKINEQLSPFDLLRGDLLTLSKVKEG